MWDVINERESSKWSYPLGIMAGDENVCSLPRNPASIIEVFWRPDTILKKRTPQGSGVAKPAVLS